MLNRIILFALVALNSLPVSALEISGPALLKDGDGLLIGGVEIRLHDIDAFENGQDCERGGRSYNCGSASEKALRAIVAGKIVSCAGTERGSYGRLLGTCFADGVNVNREMVLTGYAFGYRGKGAYLPEERQAQEAKRGAWSGTFTMPWTFRDNGWANAAQEAPDGRCPIKGNISGRGHVYHTPWSRSYRKTKIDTAKGERWFCDEAEAVAAGWRAPYR